MKKLLKKHTSFETVILILIIVGLTFLSLTAIKIYL